GIGLVCYFTIGFYVAALVSAFVSMLVVLLSTWLMPASFDWSRLSSMDMQGAKS
ncbi:MAG: urea transporter, partial [Gammaproteobacteria bacterium]